MEEKKIWFKGFNRRLWIPVSIEGWIVTASFSVCILILGKINNISNDVNFTMSKFLPIVVEFAVIFITFYFITKGHVDKNY